MDRDTKEEQKRIDQKMVNVAYGTTSGAVIGVVIGVGASVIAGAGAASIVPIVGAVAGGIGGLFAVSTITKSVEQTPNNSSESEK